MRIKDEEVEIQTLVKDCESIGGPEQRNGVKDKVLFEQADCDRVWMI